MPMMPRDVPIIDTLLNIPQVRPSYDFLRPLLRDRESRESFEFPVQHLFKDYVKLEGEEDYVRYTLEQMDRHNIERAMVAVSLDDPVTQTALRDHPDRFIPSSDLIDPNRGMDAVREITRLYEEFGIRAVTALPAATFPQAPINDARWYPVFAKCVELDIAFFCCMGVPGPRIPMATQKVELVDEICWFFPELRFVFRHGCEPWEDLAVKLMLKWPNLYYSTSAFAPRYYPKAIVDFANTRGADKILYAGYFPAGLSLERIMNELPEVPFRDHVWPKFLRENALKVLKLD